MTRLSIMDSIARPLRILCDNNIVVFYTKNNKTSKGSKHLKLKCPTIRDLVKDGSIVVKHVDTNSMLVDPLIKGLRPIVFKRHVENMGIVSSFDILG